MISFLIQYVKERLILTFYTTSLGEGWHEKRMHNKAKNEKSNTFMV